jgi:hypothetical protein
VLLVEDSTLGLDSHWRAPAFVDSLIPGGQVALVPDSEYGLQRWVFRFHRADHARVPLVPDSILMHYSLRRALIAESLTTKVPVVLVPDSLSRTQDWSPIYRRHRRASAIFALSRVWFNSDTTRAVVELQALCAPVMCGATRLFVLARAPGRAWTVWRDDAIIYY